MKRFALAILVVTAVAVAVFLTLHRPGAQASPGATITVNSTADIDTRDGVITLRGAILLATGELSASSLTEGECDGTGATAGESKVAHDASAQTRSRERLRSSTPIGAGTGFRWEIASAAGLSTGELCPPSKDPWRQAGRPG